MLEKRINFRGNQENCSIDKISFDTPLEKVASNKVSDEIKDYIAKNIEKDPDYVFVLVSALGAGEYWGPNVNADYFPEEEILDSYKTFEEYGHVFTHHENKDPKKSKGEILLSHYNPRMKRVELVVKINRDKAPKVCKDIDNGEMWDVSMGCKVPYDVCSICGNKAHTPNDYCEHIKYNKNKILDSGQQTYMININPRFFDISFVFIGADRTAKSLMKIASATPKTTKESSIDKEVPGETLSKEPNDVAKVLMEGFNRVKSREKDLPDRLLKRYSKMNLSDVLSTLASLGVVLKPQEFEKVNTDGHFRLYPKVHGEVKKSIMPFMKERSGLKHHLYPRIIRCLRREPKVRPKVTVIYKRYLSEIPKVTNLSGIPTGYMVSRLKKVDLPEDNWQESKRGLEGAIPNQLINQVTAEFLEKNASSPTVDTLAGRALKEYF